MNVLTVLAIILAVIAGVAYAYWCIVAVRVRQMLRERPTVRAGLELPEPAGGWPRLSVIVPAHNEAEVIDDCVTSLRKQNYSDLELIFVLDRCTDQTRAILDCHVAEDDRIIIIENEECPDDWAGKCNAARLGSERATGDYLLFTDADTQFDPDLSRASVALVHDRDLGLFSLLSSLTFDRVHEFIAQPVASMHLVRLYPFKRLSSEKKIRPFANGQFMLFQRKWYETLGGHGAVKDALLEDLAFARLLQDQGGECATFLADGMLSCAMYHSMTAFKEGWKRIFIEACRRKPGRLRKNAWRVLTTGVIVPSIQTLGLVMAVVMAILNDLPLAIVLGGLVIAGWFVQGFVLARIYRAGGAPLRALLWYPLGCWIVGRIMFDGARDLIQRRPVRWGGRQYVLEPR